MSTIRREAGLLTLINVFTGAPEHQQKLVDVLIEATEQTMRHMTGFVSANIHRSFDGTRVINYAQWRSREDFEAMTQDPEAKPHMASAAALAKFEPILCEVVEAISSDKRSMAAPLVQPRFKRQSSKVTRLTRREGHPRERRCSRFKRIDLVRPGARARCGTLTRACMPHCDESTASDGSQTNEILSGPDKSQSTFRL